ncbi:DUF4287 domain-containing protein [Knoellia sp. S7-12]|uniref:DUF4287 domain-containing protein n=1 Tax=Knoellia sp. S7-12 TaxID=3126698 RepID=UPI003367C34F
MNVDAATQTMIDNLPPKTGRSLEQWFTVLDDAGLAKHGEAMALLKTEHGVSHGFANLVVLLHRDRAAGAPSSDELVDAQYAGTKRALRPILDRLVEASKTFGDDVEIAPKKTSVSLRRSKQFALVEAPSAKRVRLGLNLRDAEPTDRLVAAGGMCTHRVDIADQSEVDAELLDWMRRAYEGA